MDPLKTGLIFSLKPIGFQTQQPTRTVSKPQTATIPVASSGSSSNFVQPTPGNEGFVEPKLPLAVKSTLQDNFERLYRQTPLPAVLAGGMQNLTNNVPTYRLSAPFANLNSVTKRIDYGEQLISDTPFQRPLPPQQEIIQPGREEGLAPAVPAIAYRLSAPPVIPQEQQFLMPQMNPFIAPVTPAFHRTAEIAHAIQVENIYQQVMEKFRQSDRFIQATQTPKPAPVQESSRHSRTVGSQTKIDQDEEFQQNQNLPPPSNRSIKRSETKSVSVAATTYSPPQNDFQEDYPDYTTFEYELPPSPPPPPPEKEKTRIRPQVMSSSGMSSGSSLLAVTESSSEQEVKRRSPQKSSTTTERRRGQTTPAPSSASFSSSLVALAESSSEQDRPHQKFPPRPNQRTPMERTRATPASSARPVPPTNSLAAIAEDSSEQEMLYQAETYSTQRSPNQSTQLSHQRSPHKSPQREISVINNHTITASSSIAGLRNEKKQTPLSSSSSLASIPDVAVNEPNVSRKPSVSAASLPKAPSSAEKKRIQPQLISNVSSLKSDLLGPSISPAAPSRPAPARTRAPAQSRTSYPTQSSQPVMDSLLSILEPEAPRSRVPQNTSFEARARGLPTSAASTASIRPRHMAQYEERSSLLNIAAQSSTLAPPTSKPVPAVRQRATSSKSSGSSNATSNYLPFALTSNQDTPLRTESKPVAKNSRPQMGDESESLGEDSEVLSEKPPTFSSSSSKVRERKDTTHYNNQDDEDIPFSTSSFLDSRSFSKQNQNTTTSSPGVKTTKPLVDRSVREEESNSRSIQKPLPTSPLISSVLAPQKTISSPALKPVTQSSHSAPLATSAPVVATEQINKTTRGRPKKNKALLSETETDDAVPAPKKARKTNNAVTTNNVDTSTTNAPSKGGKDSKNSEANFFRDISEGLKKLSQETNDDLGNKNRSMNNGSSGNSNSNSQGNKKSSDWKPAERVALYKIFADTNLTEPNFWELISNGLKAKGFNRTKEECEHTWFLQVQVTEERKKSNAEKKKETQIHNTLNKVQTIQQQKEAAEKKNLTDEPDDQKDDKDQEKEKKRRLGKKDLQILAEQSSKAVKEDDYFETYEYKRQQLLKQKQQQQQQQQLSQQSQNDRTTDENKRHTDDADREEAKEENSEDTIEQQSPKKSSLSSSTIPPPPPGTPPPIHSQQQTPKIPSSRRIGESSDEEDDSDKEKKDKGKDKDKDDEKTDEEDEMANYNPFDPPKEKKKNNSSSTKKKPTLTSPVRDRSTISVLEFTNSILTSLTESISSPTTVSPTKISNNNNNRKYGRNATFGRPNLADLGDDDHNDDDNDGPDLKRKRMNSNTNTANNPINRYQGSSLFLSLSQQSASNGIDEEEKLFDNTHVHKIARGNPKSALLSTQQRARAAEKGINLHAHSNQHEDHINQAKSSNQEFVSTMKKSLHEIGQLKKRKRKEENDFEEDLEDDGGGDYDDNDEEEDEEGEEEI